MQEKKFDRNKYNQDYCKTHYVQFKSQIKPETKQRIDDYCKDMKMSKRQFLEKAIDMFEEL